MKPRNDIHGIMKRTVWGAVISRNHNWHMLSTSFQISVINKLVGIAQQADNIKPPEKRKRGRPRTRWMDAVNRYMKMVGLERKMAYDRRLANNHR